MSGRELDPDGTDSYHPWHPWEQAGHHLYVAPRLRWVGNWPPKKAVPTGPHEQSEWEKLPIEPPERSPLKTFGPSFKG